MGILDLFFPKNCFGCQKSGSYLCKDCALKLPRAKNTCPYCSWFSFQGKTHPSCQKKFGIDGIFSAWSYDGVVKKLISSFKYKYVYDMVDDLSFLFTDILKTENLFKKNFIITPVPLHKSRERWRGFNQASLLAEKIGKVMEWDFIPDLLVRTKYTLSQVRLKGDDRRINVENAFTLNTTYVIQNTSYVVFDDVVTTGSTLKEMAKVLKRAGAKKVWGLTLAA